MQERRRSKRIARIFHDGPLTPGTDLQLDKQASHHLVTVLRANADDPIVLFNGDGLNVHATIVSAGQRGQDKRAVLRLERCEAGITDSPLHITLVQCVSRPERMDISLRQAVELGVNSIQPVYSRHSIKLSDEKRAVKKQQHWQSIVTSACEQCGRATIPSLSDAMSYKDWLDKPIPPDNTHFILSPVAGESLSTRAHDLTQLAPLPRTTLIIGPESGLDTDEIDQAISAGATPVHMGSRILRTETAGPACIVLLQSILGDLKQGYS